MAKAAQPGVTLEHLAAGRAAALHAGKEFKDAV